MPPPPPVNPRANPTKPPKKIAKPNIVQPMSLAQTDGTRRQPAGPRLATTQSPRDGSLSAPDEVKQALAAAELRWGSPRRAESTEGQNVARPLLASRRRFAMCNVQCGSCNLQFAMSNEQEASSRLWAELLVEPVSHDPHFIGDREPGVASAGLDDQFRGASRVLNRLDKLF